MVAQAVVPRPYEHSCRATGEGLPFNLNGGGRPLVAPRTASLAFAVRDRYGQFSGRLPRSGGRFMTAIRSRSRRAACEKANSTGPQPPTDADFSASDASDPTRNVRTRNRRLPTSPSLSNSPASECPAARATVAARAPGCRVLRPSGRRGPVQVESAGATARRRGHRAAARRGCWP